MSLQVILTAGEDTGQMQELREALSEALAIETHHLEKLDQAEQFMVQNLPDLVMIYADSLEQAGEDVGQFCLNQRYGNLEHRPVLVVLTDTLDEKQRISYLVNGADDALTTHLSVEELRVRLLVHLRRNLDVLSHRLTHLPGLALASKILQRKINREEEWALVLIELDNFDTYTEVYGYIPGDQVLRTFASLMGQLVMPPDLIGHTDTNQFLILTNTDKAEKLAAMLCRQFDSVVPNFYSERDRKRGYIVSVEEGKLSRRIRLMTLSIGIVSSQVQAFTSYKEGLTAANDMKTLAKRSPGSTWVSDRWKLTGTQTTGKVEKKSLLVVESDAALAFLLKTTLEMQGYEVETVSNAVDAMHLMMERPWSLVLLDSLLGGEATGWTLCQEIRERQPDIMIIFISTLHDREKALNSGADLYIPKPFELIPLFTWIERLLQGH